MVQFGLVIKMSLSVIALSNAFVTVSRIISLTSTKLVQFGLAVKMSLKVIGPVRRQGMSTEVI